jgi:hypothetical protein
MIKKRLTDIENKVKAITKNNLFYIGSYVKDIELYYLSDLYLKEINIEPNNYKQAKDILIKIDSSPYREIPPEVYKKATKDKSLNFLLINIV